MTRAVAGSWLVPLADLSMILFVITGSAMSARPPQATPVQQGGFAQGTAAAVFIDSGDGPTLSAWLAQTPPGPGQQVTIEGRFPPSARTATLARVEHLAAEAMALGVVPRVILQPVAQDSPPRVQALIAHDAEQRR